MPMELALGVKPCRTFRYETPEELEGSSERARGLKRDSRSHDASERSPQTQA
jgi:hypothetical protein